MTASRPDPLTCTDTMVWLEWMEALPELDFSIMDSWLLNKPNDAVGDAFVRAWKFSKFGLRWYPCPDQGCVFGGKANKNGFRRCLNGCGNTLFDNDPCWNTEARPRCKTPMEADEARQGSVCPTCGYIRPWHLPFRTLKEEAA